jgi:hypothetical protein
MQNTSQFSKVRSLKDMGGPQILRQTYSFFEALPTPSGNERPMTGPGKSDTLPQGSQALKTGGCACPRVRSPETVYPSSSVCICIMRIDPRGKSKVSAKSVPSPPLVRGCVLEESSRKSSDMRGGPTRLTRLAKLAS